MCKGHGVGVVGFRGGCFSRFCGTWSLLASSVFFCETLLSGFAFPVVVSHSASVDYQSASKLAEHGSCSYDGNLSWSVWIGQHLLVDKIVFLRLRSNDLEERPVLVE
jgi:hypothetical protein